MTTTTARILVAQYDRLQQLVVFEDWSPTSCNRSDAFVDRVRTMYGVRFESVLDVACGLTAA